MTVRWPRLLTPTHLSQIIRNQKNPLIALRIFKEAKDKYPNYRHNGPVYATMIGILGSSGRITEMKEVLDQMREDSCECKDSIFANAIKTYARVGLLNEAISLFKNIPQFNCVNWTESFNTLLQIMVKESKLEAAHRLFLESSYGWEVKSRVRSLNLLMDVLCQHNRSDVALQVFQEMNYQGCYPDRDSYRIVMMGLCKDGRLNEATHLLYSMFWRISQKGSGEDIVIYRIFLDALCDIGMVEQALEVLGKILRKGLKAPKRCHPRLDLSNCNSDGNIETTKHLINEALIRGAIPSLSSYTAMAVDFYAEGKLSQADKVLDETQDRGFRPSLLTYEAKVAALCKEGKVHEAINVLEVEMVEGNCVPNVRLYNILLKGLCDARNSATAVKYLKRMAKQTGCVANKETYCILVHGLCQDGGFIEASRILEEMLIKSYWPPVDTFNMLIRGLCSIGRQYEATMWLEEMISLDEAPELSVWNSLVTCLCSNTADIDACCETFKRLSNCS
ncbi:pentatricopeptide repeat-containing protein At1g05600 [Ricinus communis]|uniref:Pentatricopeptide repeat-containing protein, putative n=1 Tax=Ricinus communis TaxID=3988 RepID=B9RNK1_RICCO|nr:pentatricopeptide repeat-containing protein At1g05600 [Ricinus communis]EEF47056.1 pentatricopeptide repeat-containing protein, putative [Ricinus communis]|eukprot:XP_002515072.1 pentatricopeptide repeat-containing protein At1g05600 [Ricinus communis]